MAQLIRFKLKIDAGLLIALALTLFAVQALWQPGLPTLGDLPNHLYRTLEYERSWAPGVLLPLWGQNMAFGYGYPLFVFAPPLPYLLGVFFHTAGLSIETSFKLLLGGSLLLYAAGIYLLARDLLGSSAAGLVAAVAFALAPFTLREALLYGGNVPQLLAIGLFPWPLWTALRAARSGAWFWVIGTGLFYAALMLSHLFQVFIFTPVLALFILLLIFGPRPGPRRWRLLAALPGGLLLSAFFWLPALIERNFTRARPEIYLSKSPFYVRYPYWPELTAWIQPLDARAANPYVPLTLGLVTLLLAGAGLLAILWRSRFLQGRLPPGWMARPLAPLPRLALLFFGLLAAGGIFLVLPASRPIWESLPLLQIAQFPWRLLGLVNLGLALLAGAALLLLPARGQLPAAGLIVLLQLGAVAPLLYPTIPFIRYGEPSLADQAFYERRSQSLGFTTLSEYLPRTVSAPPESSALTPALEAGQQPERLDRTSLPPQASAEKLTHTAVTHRYAVDSPAPFTLRLLQYYYPGWRATLDGRPLALRPEPETGLILADLPAGTHTVTIEFGLTWWRWLARGLSGLTGLGLLSAWLITRTRPQPIEPSSGPPLKGKMAPPQSSPKSPLSPWERAGVRAIKPTPPKSEARRRDPPDPEAPRPTRLPLNRVTVMALVLIIGAALGLKPLLRPLFTLNSPPDRILPAQHQTEIRFANGIELAGYDLSRRVAEPGGYLQVVLYWQTDSAPYRDNLQPFVHLDRLDDFTTLAGGANYTPGDVTTESNLPTFHWDNQRYVRDEHDLLLPRDAEPLAYALRVGLINSATGALVPLVGEGDTAQLTTVNLRPAQREPARLAQPLAVRFENQNQTDAIDLTGFEITALTPDRLAFALAWQTDRRPQQDYTVFAQLLDSEQNLAASFDGPPLGGAYPTSTWLPGQTIIDRRTIPLTETPPGQYRLIVGLYETKTGRRLTTPDGADFVDLGPIVVEKS